MSIISEALKRANADRHRSAAGRPSPKSAGSTSIRPWFSSVLILVLLVLPFALPRLLQRPADAPAAGIESEGLSASASGAGLAQTSIESQGLPPSAAMLQPATSVSLPISAGIGVPAASPARQGAVTSIGGRHLQGIVWTANKGYYAIMDSEVIRVGSLVGNLRVTQITPAGVELKNETETVFIEKAF